MRRSALRPLRHQVALAAHSDPNPDSDPDSGSDSEPESLPSQRRPPPRPNYREVPESSGDEFEDGYEDFGPPVFVSGCK